MNGSARNGTSLASLTVMSSGVTPDPIMLLTNAQPRRAKLKFWGTTSAELAKFGYGKPASRRSKPASISAAKVVYFGRAGQPLALPAGRAAGAAAV
eukprot:scaffold27397_cov77-Phaeocystis_antarctica.AAC.2